MVGLNQLVFFCLFIIVMHSGVSGSASSHYSLESAGMLIMSSVHVCTERDPKTKRSCLSSIKLHSATMVDL